MPHERTPPPPTEGVGGGLGGWVGGWVSLGGWVGQLGWVGGLASPEAAPKMTPRPPPSG